MSKNSQKSPRDRMIHIRLDIETHKRLKINAAQKETTIQQLVADLIHHKYVNSERQDVE